MVTQDRFFGAESLQSRRWLGGASGQPGQPPRKRKKFGLGDILNGTIPVP